MLSVLAGPSNKIRSFKNKNLSPQGSTTKDNCDCAKLSPPFKASQQLQKRMKQKQKGTANSP